MNVDWEAIGATAELLGAVAVVVSLVYLALQLRTNTRALRANASWDAEFVFAQRNERLSRDPDALALIQKGMDPGTELDSLTELERSQLFLDSLSLLQTIQAQYFMWKSGSLPDEVWAYRSVWTKRYLLLPVPAYFWQTLRDDALLSREFVDYIDGIDESEGARGPSR